jgi:predicted signal transduction protein with EAL and GGDEF domain
MINISYALAAFLIIEVLLFFALRKATFSMEKMISAQTSVLREMAVHDELTGLYNRHYLGEFLEKEYAIASRHGRTFSVAIMDLDHFKSINDEHGHLFGDQVLADTANLILSRLGSGFPLWGRGVSLGISGYTYQRGWRNLRGITPAT